VPASVTRNINDMKHAEERESNDG